MDMDISIIIPAYNEEKYIEEVLKVVTDIPGILEVIVVSDGSTDNTVQVAQKYPVKVIELPVNLGKGGAMMAGVRGAKGKYLLFLDADLVGLKPIHITSLISAIENEDLDMVVGVFDSGRISTDLAQVVAPFLSGQRIVKKEHLLGIDNLDAARFGVEIELTKYAVKHKLKVKEVVLEDLTHVMKEEKLGFVKGFAYRMKMYWEIAKNVKNG